MKAGLYHFYLQLKKNGTIQELVTWEQFYRSKIWIRKDKLNDNQKKYIKEKIYI